MKPLEGLNGSVEHDRSAGREQDVGGEPVRHDRACPWVCLAGATKWPLCYKYKSEAKSWYLLLFQLLSWQNLLQHLGGK